MRLFTITKAVRVLVLSGFLFFGVAAPLAIAAVCVTPDNCVCGCVTVGKVCACICVCA